MVQSLFRDMVGHLPKRQVRCRQSDSQIPCNQQHHGRFGARDFCQIFRVPGKCDAGIVDDAFLQRRSNQPCEAAVQAAVYSQPQAVQQYFGIGLQWPAAIGYGGERRRDDPQFAFSCGSRVVRSDLGDANIQARGCSAAPQ